MGNFAQIPRSSLILLEWCYVASVLKDAAHFYPCVKIVEPALISLFEACWQLEVVIKCHLTRQLVVCGVVLSKDKLD